MPDDGRVPPATWWRVVTDLRGTTALTLGAFGLLLVLEGLLSTTPEDLAKTGGLHLNLWTGSGLLVVAGLFGAAALVAARRPAGPGDD